MNDLLKRRMALKGETVSDAVRHESNEIKNKTFTNDSGYRKCKLYSRTMQLLESMVEIQYQYSQVYTINKDQVEYLAQFRPGYHPEKKFTDPDGVERFGFYLEIPEKNSGVNEMWLILGRNDKDNFIRYNILKCNWTFKWIKNGIIYSCLGIIRNRNNYNSGVWSDGFFTSVDNQAQFIVPTTLETQMIDYNDRFMLSDSSIRPLVYEVSKIEDAFPCGATKFTLKQDHYNKAVDNTDLKICDYYSSPIEPDEPLNYKYNLECSGTSNTLRIGGTERSVQITPIDEYLPLYITWLYCFRGKENLTAKELTEDFVIKEFSDHIQIAAVKNFNNLGEVIKITAKEISNTIELEVKR